MQIKPRDPVTRRDRRPTPDIQQHTIAWQRFIHPLHPARCHSWVPQQPWRTTWHTPYPGDNLTDPSNTGCQVPCSRTATIQHCTHPSPPSPVGPCCEE